MDYLGTIFTVNANVMYARLSNIKIRLGQELSDILILNK